jgi:hypothetical protein
MDINEIRDKKSKLESELKAAIENFEKETTCKVESIDFLRRSTGDGSPIIRLETIVGIGNLHN